MKILFIITRADTIAGAQVHVRDLCNFLKTEHEILVLTGSEGAYTKDLERNGIDYISYPNLIRNISFVKDYKSLLFFQKIIHDFEPDIIATHSSKAGILGRISARKAQKPCVFTAHGWSFSDGVPQPTRSIYKFIETLAEKISDKIICVSEFDRRIGLHAGMSPNKLETIHNGMPDIPDNLMADPTFSVPVNLIMIARFDAQKDHQSLLKAIRNISNLQVKLVGDGPKLEETKKIADELGIRKQVDFLGFREDISSLLSKAQIFALISNWEGFPCTIIEAMRAGLPVIASEVGGVPESVVDGVTGYCIPRGDVSFLHKKLEELVQNPELRQAMGNAGRQRYETRFTFANMFNKTLNTYEQVLTNYSK